MKERDHMKTLVTLAIASLFAVTTASAEVVTKGGAARLFTAPAANGAAAVATTRPLAKPMVCAMCKSEFVTTRTPSFKGTAPALATVERHACADCGTKWVTTGHGKAKVETAVHTCVGCKG